MAAKSHHSYNYAIMKSLHSAGHDVTMISPFPSERKIKNLTYIDSRSNTSFIYIGQTPIEHFRGMKLSEKMDFFLTMDIQYCYDVMQLKEIKVSLYSPRESAVTELCSS